jgi:6-pyruvoyltetrahydropterin/6-carboxytetrahydropterin synthase
MWKAGDKPLLDLWKAVLYDLSKEAQLFEGGQMKMVTEQTIAASHFLPDHMGKCKNLHGHNWRVRVMIEGSLIEAKGDPQNGMIVDFGKVKEVLNTLDHKHLNDVLDTKMPPTAEHMAKFIGEQLIVLQANILRVVVQIYESDKSYIEWDSDDDWDEQTTAEIGATIKIAEDEADLKQKEADKDIEQQEEENGEESDEPESE